MTLREDFYSNLTLEQRHILDQRFAELEENITALLLLGDKVYHEEGEDLILPTIGAFMQEFVETQRIVNPEADTDVFVFSLIGALVADAVREAHRNPSF